jgi:hypothetical protein
MSDHGMVPVDTADSASGHGMFYHPVGRVLYATMDRVHADEDVAEARVPATGENGGSCYLHADVAGHNSF